MQFSVSVRNARLDAIEDEIGAAAVLRIFEGALPANCAAADAGTKLVEISLPADWMNAASSGSKLKSGTWSDYGIVAGTAQYFRAYDAAAVTCHVQGTLSATGGGGDMTADSVSVALNQVFTVNSFTLNEGNS